MYTYIDSKNHAIERDGNSKIIKIDGVDVDKSALQYAEALFFVKSVFMGRFPEISEHDIVKINDEIDPFIRTKEVVIGLSKNTDRYINTHLSNTFAEFKLSPPELRGFSLRASMSALLRTEPEWWYALQVGDNHRLEYCCRINDGSEVRLYVEEIIGQRVKSYSAPVVGVTTVRELTAEIVNFISESIRQIGKQLRIDQGPESRITIALDYDGTVTCDTVGFATMAKYFKSRGHKVYIVTMRYASECESDPDFMALTKLVDGYVATGRQSKRTFCKNRNIFPHVWIDDNPQAVDQSAVQIWGTASKEGDIVIEQHSN